MKFCSSSLAAVVVLGAFVTVVDAGINCYVCDTTRVDNYDQQICDDTFLPSRGATIETGCAACTKEKTHNSGVMFIKRGCERSLRWESSVWSCSRSQDEREYVFGLPGTRCICLDDYCNAASHLTHSIAFTLLTLFVAKLFL